MRRGLSELIGALIVTVIIVSSMAFIINVYDSSMKRMKQSSLEVSKRIITASQPIYFSLLLENNKLIMNIYVFNPIRIESIIYINNNLIKYIKINKTIYDYGRFTIDSNYNCAPSRVFLILEDGTLIPYSPQRDPRVLLAPANIRATLYTKSYIDCDYLDELNNISNWGNHRNSTIIYIYNKTFKLIEAPPAKYSLVRGNPYTVKLFYLKIKGNLTINGRVVFQLYNGTGEQLLASNEIKVPSESRAISKFLESFQDDGKTIDMYSRIACAQPGFACVVGIAFRLHNSTGSLALFSGNAEARMKIIFHYSHNNCDYNNVTYIAPVIYAPISSFHSKVKGTCREYYGTNVNFTGKALGRFTTPQSLALLASTSPGENFEIESQIYFREVMQLNINKSSLILNLNNSIINYRRIKINPKYKNALTKSLILFNYDINNKQLMEGSTYYKVIINGIVLYRPINENYLILPTTSYNNITLYYDPPHTIPMVTSIEVKYLKKSTGLPKEYYYIYNISSQEKPLGYPSLLPALVIIKDLSHNINYLIGFPIEEVYILQLNKKYYGLSMIISGLSFTISNNNLIYFELIELSDLQKAAVYIPTDIYNRNMMSFNSKELVLKDTGSYIVLIKINLKNINLYKVIILIVY